MSLSFCLSGSGAVNPTHWRKDEEFARQMIAGANPVCIKRVTKFPLPSELDSGVFGDQDSKITKDHVEKNMGGMTVQQVCRTTGNFFSYYALRPRRSFRQNDACLENMQFFLFFFSV